MSLVIWLALGGDASSVVGHHGVIIVRVITVSCIDTQLLSQLSVA